MNFSFYGAPATKPIPAPYPAPIRRADDHSPPLPPNIPVITKVNLKTGLSGLNHKHPHEYWAERVKNCMCNRDFLFPLKKEKIRF